MRYFKNNYKKMLMPTIFLTIIGLISFVIPILTSEVRISRPENNSIMINGLSIFLLISVIFLPIYEFRIIKNKRGADMFYSLPLNKSELNLQIYLKGLIQLVISYTIIVILGFVLTLLKGFDFKYIYYLPLYFVYLGGAVLYYTFNVFIFSKANNIIDGIILIGLYIIVPFIVISLVKDLFKVRVSYIDYNMPTTLLFNFNYYFQNLINPSSYNNAAYSITGISSFIFWSLISITFGLLGYFYTRVIKPENIEQISDSYFSYKTLIPLTTFSLISIIPFYQYFDLLSVFLFTLIIIVTYIGYVIYERTFKISKNSLIIILSTIVLGIVFNLIIS